MPDNDEIVYIQGTTPQRSWVKDAENFGLTFILMEVIILIALLIRGLQLAR